MSLNFSKHSTRFLKISLSQEFIFNKIGVVLRNKNASCFSTTNHLGNQQPQKKPDWNRAVSEAEKLVGYPTSYLTLRSLFSDEMSNIAIHLRKLIGTSHPILKTAKRLIYNGRNNMQTRGLIVLLISKAAGHKNSTDMKDHSCPDGVSHNQRSLAEISEMIHTAHLIHKGVVNLSDSKFPDGSIFSDMEFGNKISILSGDYLLANACTALAALRHPEVVELISTAISDFLEAEFIGMKDSEDNALPSDSFTIEDWEQKNFLAAGSLMAKSCKGAVMLAEHSEEVQERAFEFGRHLALAWQLFNDLQPFVDLYRHPPGIAFDLSSAPVIFHLQKNPDPFLKIVQQASDLSPDNCDYEKLHELVLSGSSIKEAQTLCHQYIENALGALGKFGHSEARTALENIVCALHEILEQTSR